MYINLKCFLSVIVIAVISNFAYRQNLERKQAPKGKWGIVDESGKWIIKPKYTASVSS